MKTDLFGNIPKVGDIIVFNPPRYKGVAVGKIVGFGKTGFPQLVEIKEENSNSWMYWEITDKGYYTVKTNFVIK